MQDRLKKLNIGKIVIADDRDENIYAAKQFGETLPGIGFEYFQRGDVLVECIPERYKEFDLILTDRQMETDEAGFDVIETGFNYYIPTFIVSGGYQHAGNEVIRICPGIAAVEGSKNSKETWQKILSAVIEPNPDPMCGRGPRSMLDTVQRARSALEAPCKMSSPIGEFARHNAESFFRYQV